MNQIIKTKLTKSFLNKTIKWSTSRYNVMKKPDVINEIVKGMNNGGLWITDFKETYQYKYQTRDITPLKGMERIEYLKTEWEYSSGSYCECSSMTTTGTYFVNFADKSLKDIDNNIVYQF
jgi:hypothetical protein